MSNLNTLKLIATLAFAAACLPTLALAEEPAVATGKPSTAVAQFKIEGMVTSACPVLVKRAASKVAGVKRVSASLEKKSAEIEYDPSKTNPEAIARFIKDRTGLRARHVETGCTEKPTPCR